jgi:hypothetical protein
MTALAVALVLCCAMVCGTVLASFRYHERMAAQERLPHVGDVDTKLHLLDDAYGRHDRRLASLQSEVESLRAQVALRSM